VATRALLADTWLAWRTLTRESEGIAEVNQKLNNAGLTIRAKYQHAGHSGFLFSIAQSRGHFYQVFQSVVQLLLAAGWVVTDPNVLLIQLPVVAAIQIVGIDSK